MNNIIFLLSFSLYFIAHLGCDNPFATREAEEPPVNIKSTWITPTSADIVLINFERAIFERNVENYIRCFIDQTLSDRSFKFEPDQEIVNNLPTLFDGWTLESERNYINQLFSVIPDDSLAQLILSDTTRFESDTTIFWRTYNLTVDHTLNRTEIPNRFAGEAEFHIAEMVNGEMAIYRWIDRNTQNDLTWSFLKSAF